MCDDLTGGATMRVEEIPIGAILLVEPKQPAMLGRMEAAANTIDEAARGLITVPADPAMPSTHCSLFDLGQVTASVLEREGEQAVALTFIGCSDEHVALIRSQLREFADSWRDNAPPP